MVVLCIMQSTGKVRQGLEMMHHERRHRFLFPLFCPGVQHRYRRRRPVATHQVKQAIAGSKATFTAPVG